MAVLKTIETETHVTIVAPIYRVPLHPMLGAHGASSLWLALLACWRGSSNEMSLHKSRYCIIRWMSPWHFVFQPHIHTLQRDPPLAEPGKIAVQFFSLFSWYRIRAFSNPETVSCTIYLFTSFQPSMTQRDDLSGRLHPYTGCNPVRIPVLSYFPLFETVWVSSPWYVKIIVTFFLSSNFITRTGNAMQSFPLF
jgi:hypothetical protein